MHIFLQPPASGATEKGVTEKGNERIRSILEEAKNALVDERFLWPFLQNYRQASRGNRR